MTDDEGHFRLRTDAGDDGAVVGPHRVCLTDLNARPGLPSRPVGGEANPDARVPASRLPEDYGNAAKTPLQGVEVRPGKQALDFDLPPADRP